MLHMLFRLALACVGGLQVAVKLLPLTDVPANRERLQREVTLLLKAMHNSAHVVKVLGLTVKDHKLAIVMKEYPQSLGQLMHSSGIHMECMPKQNAQRTLSWSQGLGLQLHRNLVSHD